MLNEVAREAQEARGTAGNRAQLSDSAGKDL